MAQADAQFRQARLELGPPVAIPAASIFNTDDVINAAGAIDQHTCAFELSGDTRFLDEVKKVMHMVETRNPYVNGCGLTELYKFAYGIEIQEKTITEVVDSMRGSVQVRVGRSKVRRLYELLREGQIYLSLTNVTAYIEMGCAALRRPRQTALDDIKDLIATLPKPVLSEARSQIIYDYLIVVRKCQGQGFDSWDQARKDLRPGHQS